MSTPVFQILTSVAEVAGGRVFQAWNREPWKDVSRYCWWKKSCTTCCIWNPMKNEYSRWQLVQDCIRQQYHDRTRIRKPRYLHPDHPDQPTRPCQESYSIYQLGTIWRPFAFQALLFCSYWTPSCLSHQLYMYWYTYIYPGSQRLSK